MIVHKSAYQTMGKALIFALRLTSEYYSILNSEEVKMYCVKWSKLKHLLVTRQASRLFAVQII